MTAGIKREVPDERALAPSSTRFDLEAAMAHTSDVFEFLEGSIDDLNAALLYQATILQKLAPKAKAREGSLQHVRDVCDQVQTLVRSVKVPAGHVKVKFLWTTVCARPQPCPNVRPTWCLSLTHGMVRRAFSTKRSQLL